MDALATDILRLPAQVGAAPGLVSAAAGTHSAGAPVAGLRRRRARAGGAPLVVVAGPPPGGAPGLVVTARQGARSETVLALPDLALARPVDLADLGDGAVMALVPGHALLRLDPGGDQAVATTRRLVPGKALPDRLFTVGDTVLATVTRPDGRTSWTRLKPTGVSVAGSREPGPRLAPGQRLSRLLLDGRGRMVALADDDGAGFAAWRREDGGAWALLADRGAQRFALNGAVLDAVRWEGGVAVAAGPSPAARERLLDMPVSGEILLLGDGPTPRLLAGEARVAPEGLMLPALGAGGTARLGRGLVTRLLARPGLLVAAVERLDGRTAISGITPAREVVELGVVRGAALLLSLGEALGLVRLEAA